MYFVYAKTQRKLSLMEKLYNFDHRISSPQDINIGPFRIEITQEHCENLKKLFRQPKRTYSFDENLNRIVTKVPKFRGEIAETAVAYFDESTIKIPKLFPEVPNTTQLHDLTLILSFLTGRRVYLESQLDNDPTCTYSDRVVGGNFFYKRVDFWKNLDLIEKQGMSAALYALVCESGTNCLIGKAGYSNSAFDVVTSYWSKNNGKTKYSNPSLIKSGIAKVLTQIDSLFLRKVRDLLTKGLNEEGVEKSVVADISARLNLYSSSPSAIYKATAFLQAQGLCPAGDLGADVERRLKWVNWVRNAVAHQGDIPKDKEKTLSFETRMRISGAVVLLVGEISKVYIAKHILGICDCSLDESEKDILAFFEHGTFRGDKVFEETYDDYMERVAQRWIENGELNLS